jgi:hypothetical protein
VKSEGTGSGTTWAGSHLRLEKRQRTAPDKRWIFVNEKGNPENHLLRKLKAIAKRAGLNCGNCRTTLTEGRYEKRQVGGQL